MFLSLTTGRYVLYFLVAPFLLLLSCLDQVLGSSQHLWLGNAQIQQVNWTGRTLNYTLDYEDYTTTALLEKLG